MLSKNRKINLITVALLSTFLVLSIAFIPGSVSSSNYYYYKAVRSYVLYSDRWAT
jgi:hypothetical protein